MAGNQPGPSTGKVFQYTSRFDIFLLILSTVASVIQGALMPMMTIVFGQLTGSFDGLTSHQLDGNEFVRKLNQFTLYFVYLAIAEFVSSYTISAGFNYASESFTCKLRQRYVESLLSRDVRYFDKAGSGVVSARIGEDVNLIRNAVSEKVGGVIAALSTFIAAFIIGFVYSWKLTLILSSTLLAFLLIGGIGAKNSMEPANEASAVQVEAATLAGESIGGVSILMANCAQGKLLRRYLAILERAKIPGQRSKIWGAGMMAGITFIMIAAYGLALWQGSRFVVQEDISLSHILTVLLAVLMSTVSIGLMGPNIQAITLGLAAWGRITSEINDDEAGTGDEQRDLDGDVTKLDRVQGHISFDKVNFTYESRPDVPVLVDVSFDIPAGKTTALVGVSGSGKSTIVSLLERFYEPSDGTISLDRHPLRALDKSWLRGRMGLVGQEPTLFNTTIFENIAYGLGATLYQVQDPEMTKEMVMRAAKIAHAHDFIRSLPEGYHSTVGDGGGLLSGGQKQRVAIARAVVANPDILLLDEATSALDGATELSVLSAFKSAMRDRTNVIIAHRLSTIREADWIVVLNKGRVIEQGDRQHLIGQRGSFWRLLESQHVQSTGEIKPDSTSIHVEEERGFSTMNKGDVEEYELLSVHGRDDSPPTGASQGDELGFWTAISFIYGFNRDDWMLMFGGLLLSAVYGCGNTAQSVLFSLAIYEFSKHAGDNEQMRAEVDFWAGMMVMLASVLGLAWAGQGISFALCSERLLVRVRHAVLGCILSKERPFFDQPSNSPGALGALLTSRTADLAGLSGTTLGSILVGLATVASAVAVACAVQWKLGLACSATIPLLLASGYMRLSFPARAQDVSRQRYAQASSHVSEAAGAIRTVAALRLERTVARRFNALAEAAARQAAVAVVRSSVLYAFSQALVFGSFAVGFWYGGRLVHDGECTMLQFLICYASIIFGAQSTGGLLASLPDIEKARSAARVLTALLGHEGTADHDGGEPARWTDGRLSLEGVTFAYPTRKDATALRDVSLDAPPGRFVGIVGPSGSGKSSTLALLERFYSPQRGGVALDGCPVDGLQLASYRQRIGYVIQEPVLLPGTIRDNLLLAVPENDAAPDYVLEQACRDAAIHDFIASLPQGLDTPVGNKGLDISGGQKQRLALAVMLVKNPRVLLLDEATSALDPDSEKQVQAGLRAVEGRTVLAVAQRLSTVRYADDIYVVENGAIVEAGTHEELLAKRGLYASMVEVQNS